jgi:integrase
MASLRKRGKVWYYRYVDSDGVKREAKGCPDKRATEEMARAAEAEAARERAGLIDPKARRIAEAARRPIREHVNDYIASLTDANRNRQHIAQTRTYITRILTLAKIERTSDLAPSGVMRALGELASQGFSARSVNAHATAIKAFSRWLWRDGRTIDYALNAVVKRDETTDRRRIRRVLTADELGRLIEATRTAPPWRGLPGSDRVMLYAVAASTGFRRDELESLTPASFRLDLRPPMIVCEAGYTKNHRQAEQPIPETLASLLRPWLASKATDRPVFHPLSQKTGLMLATDLKRCGIESMDDAGRVVDMHSLRHGYITTLAKAGVPVKVLQTLARHSDPKLTLNVYSHLTVFDTAGALDALPDLTTPRPSSEPAKWLATGTDGEPISEHFAHHLPTGGDGSGRDLSVSGECEGVSIGELVCHNPLEQTGVDASCRGLTYRVGDGIRTRDTQIHKQLWSDGRNRSKARR